MEILIAAVFLGTAVGFLCWSGDDYFRRTMDLVEADFRKQLRRMRMSTRHLRSSLVAWWLFALGVWGVLWFVFDVPLLGICLTALMVALPWFWVRRMAERRALQIEDQLADAMVSLASAIKAGLSLAQSLEILAQQSPRPIAEEFQQIVGEYQMGKTLEKCLTEARARLRSENFALFAAAMQASRDSGGRLNETVERIALSVREMQRLDRKIQADTAQARTSAVYMACVPFVILALYYFVVDPVNTERLFTTVLGQVFLCAALVLNVVAYLWARKILNPDI
jgi:tight adherence protein B